jgi:hypothetical protein
MVKGWGSATVCLHVLLIALVIPELTPDVRELSSSSLFRILLTGSANSQAGDGDSAPLPDHDPAEMPDGASIPACVPLTTAWRRLGVQLRHGPVPAHLGEEPTGSIIRHIPARRGPHLTSRITLSLLCRRTC